MTIMCLVCHGTVSRDDFHKHSWRLAKNRIGGYVCGKACDDVIAAADRKAPK